MAQCIFKSPVRAAVAAKATIVAALAIAALALSACIRDNVDSLREDNPNLEAGRPATISFVPVMDGTFSSTRATRADDYRDPDELDPNENLEEGEALGNGADSEISHVVMLVYDSYTGDLAAKVIYEDSELDEEDMPLTANVLTGKYDFVFISNSFDPAGDGDTTATGLESKLRPTDTDITNPNIDHISKLSSLSVDRAYYGKRSNGTDIDIPMFTRVNGVEVEGDNLIKLPGESGPTTLTNANPWTITSTRTGIRLSMSITLTASQYGSWTGKSVGISNVPGKVWLLPGMDNNDTGAGYNFYASKPQGTNDGEIVFYGNSDGTGAPLPTATQPPVGGSARIYFDRIILPELLFTPKDDDESALTLTMNVGGTKSAPIAPYISGDDYTLPRNTWVHLNVSVQDNELIVTPDVIEWNDVEMDVEFDGRYRLSVDRFDIGFPAVGGTETLNIFTDYPNGEVKVYRDTSGGNNILSPPYASITTSSTSPLSLLAAGLANDGEDVEFSVVTMSSGTSFRQMKLVFVVPGTKLKKTITIWQMPPTYSDPSIATGEPIPYAGAFWKDNQTGERLIRIPRNEWLAGQKWSATVIEGEEWIRLDPNMTNDPNVGWLGGNEAAVDNGNDPGFDERHQVVSDATWVGGKVSEAVYTGPAPEDDSHGIFFRIGLTGTNPTPGTPRYGVIVLRYEKGSTMRYRRIFIRQGEDADYVYEPSQERPLALKIPPYNLTAPEFNGAGKGPELQITNVRPDGEPTRATFTDYPSQAGAHFYWGKSSSGVMAFNPTPEPYDWRNHPGIEILGLWSLTHEKAESCPEGYRRPYDGTSDYFRNGGSQSMPNFSDSELVQSLTVSTAAKNSNGVDGFYADGFSDRRRVVDPQGWSPKAGTAIGFGNSAVAYLGRVYFNPTTGASLFFPYAGTRKFASQVEGQLYYSGHSGSYLTSEMTIYPDALAFAVRSSMNSPSGLQISEIASIRCVKSDYRLDIRLPAPPGVLGVYTNGPNKGALTLMGSNAFEHATYSTFYGEDYYVEAQLNNSAVAMVHFLPGSLIGLYGGYSSELISDTNEQRPFSAADVAWAPTEAMLNEVKNAIGSRTGADAWAVLQSYAPSFDATLAFPDDPLRGFGDPCTYAVDTPVGQEHILPVSSFSGTPALHGINNSNGPYAKSANLIPGSRINRHSGSSNGGGTDIYFNDVSSGWSNNRSRAYFFPWTGIYTPSGIYTDVGHAGKFMSRSVHEDPDNAGNYGVGTLAVHSSAPNSVEIAVSSPRETFMARCVRCIGTVGTLRAFDIHGEGAQIPNGGAVSVIIGNGHKLAISAEAEFGDTNASTPVSYRLYRNGTLIVLTDAQRLASEFETGDRWIAELGTPEITSTTSETYRLEVYSCGAKRSEITFSVTGVVDTEPDRHPETPIHAPYGVIGYIYNPGQPNHGELTLAGSHEYAGSLHDDKVTSPLSEFDVCAVHFKWGSLVPISVGLGQGDIFNREDIIIDPTAPNAASLAALKSSIGTLRGDDAWSMIPFASGGWMADVDPCQYYFPGEGWRLPTGNPWHGGFFTHARWRDSGPGVPVAGIAQLQNDDWFMPLTGYRYPADGKFEIDHLPPEGRYWSSTSASSTHGYGMLVSYHTDVTGSSAQFEKGMALPIRCVK